MVLVKISTLKLRGLKYVNKTTMVQVRPWTNVKSCMPKLGSSCYRFWGLVCSRG